MEWLVFWVVGVRFYWGFLRDGVEFVLEVFYLKREEFEVFIFCFWGY